MAAIKRELQVKFTTKGDGEVTRSIVKVDNALKSTEATGGSVTKSIGDLSESLDKGLENSVGKAFKATDRLNSIVGQVTGALGLATLAVTAIATAYDLATKALNQNTKAQEFANKVRNQATREIDAYLAAYAALPGATAQQVTEHVREAAAIEAANRQMAEATALLEAAKQAREGAAAALRAHNKDIERGFANNIQLAKALDARKQASDRVAQADAMTQRASESYAAAVQVLDQTLKGVRLRQLRTAQSTLVLEKAWSRFGSQAAKAGRGLLNVAAPGLNQVIDLVGNRKALADAEKFGRHLGEMLGIDYGGGKPPTARSIDQTVEALAQMERRISEVLGIKSSLATVTAATRALKAEIDDLAASAGERIAAAYATSLVGLTESFAATGTNPLADALGFGAEDQADLLAIPDAMLETTPAIDAAAASLASFGDTAAKSLGQAAAAALVYGESFSEVAAQAAAGIAAQAVSQAGYQAALALAYLARGLFTGLPSDFEAAATAGASAAAFTALAAVTVPVARATGSASGRAGGGAAAGPTARDVGRVGGDSGGGGETIIINMGNQRVFATERDVGSAVARSLNATARGRGRPRIRRAAIGGA